MTAMPNNILRRTPAKGTSLGQVAIWGLPVAVVLAVLAHFSPLVAGAGFIVIFIALSASQPRIGLLLTFATVPLLQAVPLHIPLRLSISELCMAILLPIVLVKSAQMGKPLRIGPTLWPSVIYLFLCLVSSALYPHWHLEAIKAFVEMFVFIIIAPMLCASFPGGTDDLHFALEGAVGALAILAILVLATHFHYPPGNNKNAAWGSSFGAGFAITFELWLGAKIVGRKRAIRWLGLALLLIGAALFMSLSRGGWLEAITGCMVILLLRRRFILMARMAAVMLPLLVLLYLFLPHKQQHYAFDFNPNKGSIQPRIQLIHHAINEFENHPVLGVGVGLRKQVDPTNVFLITLAETGVQGLAAFLAIYAVALLTAWNTHKKLSPADPRFTLVALGAALIFGRFAHGMVDEYWLRGSIEWAWCAVGMLAAVHFEVTRQRAPAIKFNTKTTSAPRPQRNENTGN